MLYTRKKVKKKMHVNKPTTCLKIKLCIPLPKQQSWVWVVRLIVKYINSECLSFRFYFFCELTFVFLYLEMTVDTKFYFQVRMSFSF